MTPAVLAQAMKMTIAIKDIYKNKKLTQFTVRKGFFKSETLTF